MHSMLNNRITKEVYIYISRSTLKKACFQNGLLCANKSLERRMFPDKILKKNAFKISNDETVDCSKEN